MSQTESSSPQPGRHLPPVPFPTLRSDVGGFTLLRRLGSGSYGTVYLARRGDRRYALKVLSLGEAEDWAWRELEVLARLQHVGGLELVAHGQWPEHAPGWLYIAMEYVKGPTLKVWSREHNPTSHEVATLMLALAEDLEQVHAAGVIHRDIKPSNVVVREEDGRAVLVDYGVSTYKGALSVTGPALPGTRHYRSPEALRFLLERKSPTESYRARREDDLFSLGVVLYELLTGEHPFDAGDEEAYQQALLACAPLPPQQLNPRVPEELGHLCLGLLSANPKERPTAKRLQVELREAQNAAGLDWEQPLFDELEFAEQEPEEQPAWPVGEPSTPLPPTREEPAPAESATPARQHSALVLGAVLGALGLVLAVVLVAAALGVALLASRVLPTLQPAQHAPTSREVASAPKPLEGGSGAEPPAGASPAPKAVEPMPGTEPKKTTSKKSPRPLTQALRELPAGLCCLTAACTVLVACSTTPAVPARTTPQGAECPAGAKEAMHRLGDLNSCTVSLRATDRGSGPMLVNLGPIRGEMVGDCGELPEGTELRGELVAGPDRAYPRFTQAITSSGSVYPICLAANYNGRWGLELEEGEVPLGYVKIWSAFGVLEVDRF